MACPHYNIKISSRANRESVVAQAAYQSGEKLYNERDHRTKNYSRKQGVVYKEIMLPAHAPPEYRDRETLWNAVEKAEQNWNAQLARRFVIALPVELPIEQCIDLIREHCREQFVEEGMIADIAVHDLDPAGHNPHAHVMLTMRPLDKDGRWMEKAHKEYVLDENGERIRTAGGSWKTRKINTTDWNNPDNARKWRQAWEDLQNRYLEQAGRTERVSLKSYKARGIEQIPTIHMGPDVAALERKGVQTEIGDLNREIRKTNRFMAALRKYIGELMSWLTEVKAAIAEIEEEPQEIYLVDLLIRRFEERKQERLLTWESSAGMMRADNRDLKRFADITGFLREQNILTVSDLDVRFSQLEKSALLIRKELKSVNDQIKGCSRLIESQEQREKLDPVHDAYTKIFWKGRKEKYASEHQEELRMWNAADRYLKKHLKERAFDRREVLERISSLNVDRDRLMGELAPVQSEMKMLSDVKYYVRDLLPELMPEGDGLTPQRREEKKSVLRQLDQKKELVGKQDAGARREKGDIEKCITRSNRSNVPMR